MLTGTRIERGRRPLHTRIAITAISIEAGAAGLWLTVRLGRALYRSWLSRVAVAGSSMAPTLRAGDWLLVDPDAYVRRAPRVGDLVVVSDPRRADRLLIKRVAAVSPGGALEVVGDAAWASTDSRAFGPVDPDAVAGRPFFRYWPPRRAGRVR